jgi:hypothetical protein
VHDLVVTCRKDVRRGDDPAGLRLVKRRLKCVNGDCPLDLFHVVQLAVKAVGDMRRRSTREKYGRRGKAGDPEYGIKGLLKRTWRACPRPLRARDREPCPPC